MIKVVAKHYVEIEKIDDLMKLYEQLTEHTRKEKGCISYEVFQDTKDKSIVTMIEEWEDMRCLEAHFNTEHFKRLVPESNRYVTKETEVNIYRKIL